MGMCLPPPPRVNSSGTMVAALVSSVEKSREQLMFVFCSENNSQLVYDFGKVGGAPVEEHPRSATHGVLGGACLGGAWWVMGTPGFASRMVQRLCKVRMPA